MEWENCPFAVFNTKGANDQASQMYACINDRKDVLSIEKCKRARE